MSEAKMKIIRPQKMPPKAYRANNTLKVSSDGVLLSIQKYVKMGATNAIY